LEERQVDAREAFESGAEGAFGTARPFGDTAQFSQVPGQKADDEIGFLEGIGLNDESFANASRHDGEQLQVTIRESMSAAGKSWAAFVLSLPERVVRSATALAAGLAREIGNVALPRAVRRMHLYRLMVENTLQFLIEEVGEVEGVYENNQPLVERFAIRRAASHGIEAAGILAFHASPVWVLAALADLSGAGRSLIPEVSAALRAEGLLGEGDRPFESVDQLLDGLEKSAGHLAQTVNSPPLNIQEIRAEWEKLRCELPGASALPGVEVLTRNWRELVGTAEEEKVSVFRLSSLLAISAIRKLPGNVIWLSRATGLAGRRTGELFVETILDHYVESLTEIHRAGYLKFWVREFAPYIRATARQFSRGHISLTEKLLKR
jgi:hypothetical protein